MSCRSPRKELVPGESRAFFSPTSMGQARISQLAVGMVVLVIACSGPGTAQSSPPASSAASSPSSAAAQASPTAGSGQSFPPPGATPSTGPAAPAWGVLVSTPSGSVYTVSLVAIDGGVAASAQASVPSAVRCGNGTAALVP